jgi:hypothetical protein
VATRKVEVAIVGDSSSMVRAFRQADGAAGRFGKKGSKMGAIGMGLLAGGAAGAALAISQGLGAAISDGIKGFQAQNKASAQTDAALKSTGNAAGVTRKHIESFNTALERQTGLEAEVVQGGQNMLLTFTKISNAGPDKIFDRATLAAADLSVALGKDMQGSAMMVGKALNDPVKGVTALGRAGIQFTAGQKATIKSLSETGRVADAQKMILKELETQVGGSAKAFGETTPGQIAKAQNAFGEMTESVIAAVVPLLTATLPGLTAGIQNVTGFFQTNFPKMQAAAQAVWAWFSANLLPTFQSIAQSLGSLVMSIVNVFRTNWPAIKAVVVPVVAAIGGVIKSTFGVIGGILKTISALLRGDFRGAWEGLRSIGSNVLNGILALVRNIPAALLAAAKGILAAALRLGKDVVTKIAEGIGSAPGLIKRALSKLFGLAGEEGAINPALQRLGLSGKKLPEAIAKGMQSNAPIVGRIINDVTGKAANKAKDNAPGKATPIGQALSNGIATGVREAGPNVGGAISDIIRAGIEQAKNENNIKSPSGKTARVLGGPLATGIAKGIMESGGKAGTALIGIMRNAVASAKSNVVSLAGSFASMFGQAMGAGQNRQISALEAAFAADQEARQKKSLEDAITAADAEVAAKDAARSGAEDAAAAQKEYDDAVKSAADARLSLSDFNRQAEINNLRAIADADRTRNEEAINNLAARFASGQISAAQFNTELDALVGGEAGTSLGDAFALSFSLALESIKKQMQEIATIAGSDKVAVTGASPESLRAVYNDEVAKVKQSLEATYERQSEAFKKKTTKRQYVNPRLGKWKAANKKRFGLADGGITKGPTTALIGEAGREAVIPLEGTRARRMLRATGMGGSVINLTFNGVLDAREAARVLQPELNRLIRVAY